MALSNVTLVIPSHCILSKAIQFQITGEILLVSTNTDDLNETNYWIAIRTQINSYSPLLACY